MRGLCYEVAADLDRANRLEDPAERAAAQSMLDLMIPVVKAWCTDTGLAITSTNIQVHGGMGFMEETGAGQHYRDARITTIYEGTNGVQAMDLLGRKVARDGGEMARGFLDAVRGTMAALDTTNAAEASLAKHLTSGVEAVGNAVTWLVESIPADPARAAAGAVPFLEMMGLVSGGWMLARGAIEARRQLSDGSGDAGFLENKLVTARFFAETHLSQAPALLGPIIGGGALVMTLDEAAF
jgi:energy-converting hydrogenase Eha subunit B